MAYYMSYMHTYGHIFIVYSTQPESEAGGSPGAVEDVVPGLSTKEDNPAWPQ